MSKGDTTREMILEKAAAIFNRQGYSGTAMKDIMNVTGLEKGGIYNHFANKEELALAAFDYAVDTVNKCYRQGYKGKSTAPERLRGIIEVYKEQAIKPVIPGGCPVLNTATEADDTLPALRIRACTAMDLWLSTIRWIVAEGVERQELKAETDPDAVATIMLATYEGAVMMSKLYRNPIYMQRAADHLIQYLESLRSKV
jgi:AcrR family transcriptional regulator